MQFLIPGIDTTVPDCITRDMLDQLVRAATPYTAGGIGGVIVAENAPDVVTNPQLATFIWLQSDSDLVPTGSFYYYNGTTWQSILNFSGASLLDKSITAIKLSVIGASPYDILQVKSDGTQFILTNILAAITNGTLPIAKLVPVATGNNVLMSISGANTWKTVAQLISLFADNSIGVNKLEAGADRSIIVTELGSNSYKTPEDFVANYIANAAIPIAKLAGTGGVAAQSIRRNAANTDWEFYTPSIAESAYYALIVDSKPSGTAGGTFTAGSWVTRDLNTIKANQSSIISSVTGNQITFAQSGNYRIDARAPGLAVENHKAKLFKVSPGIGADVLIGSSAKSASSSSVQSDSVIQGLIAISAGDVYEIRHQCSASYSSGLGWPSSLGVEEIYTSIAIQKVI